MGRCEEGLASAPTPIQQSGPPRRRSSVGPISLDRHRWQWWVGHCDGGSDDGRRRAKTQR
eukprot:11308549-Alexandrium_andersonii.AAC.1